MVMWPRGRRRQVLLTLWLETRTTKPHDHQLKHLPLPLATPFLGVWEVIGGRPQPVLARALLHFYSGASEGSCLPSVLHLTEVAEDRVGYLGELWMIASLNGIRKMCATGGDMNVKPRVHHFR